MNISKNKFYLVLLLFIVGVSGIFLLHHRYNSGFLSENTNSESILKTKRLSRQNVTTSMNVPIVAQSSKVSIKQEMLEIKPEHSKKYIKNEQNVQKTVALNNDELLDRLESLLMDDNNSRELNQINALLTENLRKTSDQSITDRIVELLSYNTLSIEQQNYLLRFLGKLGTSDAIQALTSLIPLLNDGPSIEQLAQVFQEMGYSRWDTEMFAKNPFPLERAWQNALGNKLLESAIANAIARIGTPNGVKLLIKSVDNANNVEEIAQVLGNALAKLGNQDSIRLLGEALRNNDISQPVAYVAGYALAHNSHEQAAKTLLDWASNATENDSNMVYEWLQTTMENNSLAVNIIMKEAANKKFDTPEIKDDVYSLITEYELKQ